MPSPSPVLTAPVSYKATHLAKRIVACLDVRANDDGDLVVTKGDQYDVREHSTQPGKSSNVRNMGKPLELAKHYYTEGADEITFLNITSFRNSPLGDLPMIQLLRAVSETVYVPLTIGGGIRDYTDESTGTLFLHSSLSKGKNIRHLRLHPNISGQGRTKCRLAVTQ